MFPKLRPICGDLRVKDHMNLWRDQVVKLSDLSSDKRHMAEPPIPGYTGYIPRKDATETGLRSRYHEAATNSFESFMDENSLHFRKLQEPMKFTK